MKGKEKELLLLGKEFICEEVSICDFSRSDGKYIYFIREEETNIIKIGYSQNPIGRKSELQTGNSKKLSLEKIVKCKSRELEKRLHNLFVANWVQGEFYNLSTEDVKYIVQVLTQENNNNNNTNNNNINNNDEKFSFMDYAINYPLKNEIHPLYIQLCRYVEDIYIEGPLNHKPDKIGIIRIASNIYLPRSYYSCGDYQRTNHYLLSNDKVLVSHDTWFEDCPLQNNNNDDDDDDKINEKFPKRIKLNERFKVVKELTDKEAENYKQVYCAKGTLLTFAELEEEKKTFIKMCREFFQCCLQWDPLTCPKEINEFRDEYMCHLRVKYEDICSCGFKANASVSRGGINKGKYYYNCRFKRCQYFKWVDNDSLIKQKLYDKIRFSSYQLSKKEISAIHNKLKKL